MTNAQEWRTTSLGSVVTLQRGFDLPARKRSNGNIPIVSSSGVSGWHDLAMVTAPGVVTGRYGTIGQVFFLDRDFWPLNTTLWVSSFHGNDPMFVYYLLQRVDFATHSGKSGVPGVNRNDLHSEEVRVPSSCAEQHRIAVALSDTDALIAKLKQLISKKQAIKQGMMQELLTGRTRLPGFTKPWRTGRFEDLAFPIRDRMSPTELTQPTLLVELEHVESRSGRLVARSSASAAVSIKTVFKEGDVLFGKLRAYLRKFWLADSDGICSTEIWAFRAKTGSTAAFVRYIVETDRFIDVASGGYGTHMPRSDWGVVRNVPVEIPPREEQAAIGSALLDFDREIDNLHSLLAKAKSVKLGMMQELLTGRKRLLVVEATS